VALIHDLAYRAIAGEYEAVIPMDAPEWPAQPDYLRRALDGRSVYARPGAASRRGRGSDPVSHRQST